MNEQSLSVYSAQSITPAPNLKQFSAGKSMKQALLLGVGFVCIACTDMTAAEFKTSHETVKLKVIAANESDHLGRGEVKSSQGKEKGAQGIAEKNGESAANRKSLGCEMNAEQQALLDLVNQARARGARCGSKQFGPADAVRWNCSLQVAAQKHSRDMADGNFLGHTGSNGSTASRRATQAGYNWQGIGENVAAGQPTPKAVVAGWLESTGHCENIMRSTYSETGAAFEKNAESKYGIFWTMMFGHPAT